MNHTPRKPYRPTAPPSWGWIVAMLFTGFFLGASLTMAFVLWGLR